MASARIAVYLSHHGFGHLVRAATVLERLLELQPAQLRVLAPQPARLWPDSLRPFTQWESGSCDAGVEQSDDVTVDGDATARALDLWQRQLPGILERESTRLRRGFDLVLGDVPAAAFEAAAAAGVRSVALANFSWDWVYRELGFDAAADASAAMYAKAGLLLETAPAAPMPAFRNRLCVGMVARRPRGQRRRTRSGLGIGDGLQAVLVALRPDSASLLGLPAPLPHVVYLLPPGWPAVGSRDDVRTDCDGDFLDLVEAADVVVGKPGYGLLGDVGAAASRFLYVARPGFPENAILEGWLRRNTAARPVSREALAAGAWTHDLLRLLNEPAPAPIDAAPAREAAAALLRCLTE